MTKAAIILANGFEEIEAVSVIDVLRRAQIQCDMLGLAHTQVFGSHGIELTCTKIVDATVLDYDMVIFPGGMDATFALRDDQDLKQWMVQRYNEGKWNAAICAAPTAFARYGILDGCNYTVYPDLNVDIEAEITDGHFEDKLVVIDQKHKVITSRGPATSLPFAYALGEALGHDMSGIKNEMLYDLFLKKLEK